MVREMWPRPWLTVARGIAGALSGILAIGLCFIMATLLFWPIGGVVAVFGLTHTHTQGGITTAAGIVIYGFALLCGAAIAGPMGALLNNTFLTLLRDRRAQQFGRSAVVWGFGCALSVVLLTLISPHIGDRLPGLILLAMIGGIVTSFADLWLERMM